MGRGGAVGLIVAACSVFGTVPAAAAPPPNDDFEQAAALTPASGAPASASGTNVDATLQAGEPQPEPERGKASVWYRWEAGFDGPIRVSACASDFDARIGVFSGSELATLDLIGSGRASCSGASTAFSATAGATYSIAVYTADYDNGSTYPDGSFELTVSAPDPTVAIGDVSIPEGDTSASYAVFPVALSHPVSHAVEVDYRTSTGTTAFAWEDFEPVAGATLRFEPGEVWNQIAVKVLPDTRWEGNEELVVETTASRGTASYYYEPGLATIVDDDPRPPEGVTCSHDPPYVCREPGAGAVRMWSSGNNSEAVKTIPITKRGSSRVAMRIPPKRLPKIHRGDSIETSAEVAVSVTCVERARRCIGSRYGYDPLVRGRIVLADGPNKTNGTRVSETNTLRCGQRRPHRNHHCVLVFEPRRKELPARRCRSCSLNLVLSARHRQAKPGNKLVVGSDANRGVEQDRGRLNASVISPDAPPPDVESTRDRLRSTLEVASREGKERQSVVYSLRLDGLRKHEQIAIDASALIATGHLPYSTFVGSQLVLADGPRDVGRGRLAGRAAVQSGEITEKNGFNCTRARSAHGSPCLVRKVGFVRMKRGLADPLYVNLVVQLGARWGGRWQKSHRAKVLDSGSIQATRYEPESWVGVSGQ